MMRIVDTMKKIPSKLRVLDNFLTFSRTKSHSKEDTNKSIVVFDNEPITGIELKDIGLYWPVRSLIVRDPRGFKAYISIETVMDLLETACINKGVIVDKCIYYYNDGKTFLISTESDDYKQLVELTKQRDSAKAITSSKLEVGGVYKHKTEGDIVYLGKRALYDIAYSWIEKSNDGTLNTRIELRMPYELNDYEICSLLLSRGVEITYYNGEYKTHPEFIAERQRIIDRLSLVPFKVYAGTYFVFAYIPKNFETIAEGEGYTFGGIDLIYRRRIDKEMFIGKVGERKEAAKKAVELLTKLEIVNPDVNYKEDTALVSRFFVREDSVSAYRRHTRSESKIDELRKLGNIDVGQLCCEVEG